MIFTSCRRRRSSTRLYTGTHVNPSVQCLRLRGKPAGRSPAPATMKMTSLRRALTLSRSEGSPLWVNLALHLTSSMKSMMPRTRRKRGFNNASGTLTHRRGWEPSQFRHLDGRSLSWTLGPTWWLDQTSLDLSLACFCTWRRGWGPPQMSYMRPCCNRSGKRLLLRTHLDSVTAEPLFLIR